MTPPPDLVNDKGDSAVGGDRVYGVDQSQCPVDELTTARPTGLSRSEVSGPKDPLVQVTSRWGVTSARFPFASSVAVEPGTAEFCDVHRTP